MSIDALKKSAKKLHKALQEGKALTLMQVQHHLAQSHGYASWEEALGATLPVVVKGDSTAPPTLNPKEREAYRKYYALSPVVEPSIDLHTEMAPWVSYSLSTSNPDLTRWIRAVGLVRNIIPDDIEIQVKAWTKEGTCLETQYKASQRRQLDTILDHLKEGLGESEEVTYWIGAMISPDVYRRLAENPHLQRHVEAIGRRPSLLKPRNLDMYSDLEPSEILPLAFVSLTWDGLPKMLRDWEVILKHIHRGTPIRAYLNTGDPEVMFEVGESPSLSDVFAQLSGPVKAIESYGINFYVPQAVYQRLHDEWYPTLEDPES